MGVLSRSQFLYICRNLHNQISKGDRIPNNTLDERTWLTPTAHAPCHPHAKSSVVVTWMPTCASIVSPSGPKGWLLSGKVGTRGDASFVGPNQPSICRL